MSHIFQWHGSAGKLISHNDDLGNSRCSLRNRINYFYWPYMQTLKIIPHIFCYDVYYRFPISTSQYATTCYQSLPFAYVRVVATIFPCHSDIWYYKSETFSQGLKLKGGTPRKFYILTRLIILHWKSKIYLCKSSR